LFNVQLAIACHRKNPGEGKFMPKPAHIICEIQKNSQHKITHHPLSSQCKFYSTAQRGFCEQRAFEQGEGYCYSHWQEITEAGKKAKANAMHHIKKIEEILKPWRHDA